MNGRSKGTRTALCTLLVTLQVACGKAPWMTPTPTPSAAPTKTQPPPQSTTFTPTPAIELTLGPLMLTPTLPPSVTPPSLPIITPTSVGSVTFRSIQMMDFKTGWAIADMGSRDATHILHTADGGTIWNDVSPEEVDFVGSFFLDGHTAWAWSWGPAWFTRDGGQNWVIGVEIGGQPDLGFVDSQHGWKLDYEAWGLSFRQFDIISFATTQDGGLTWQETNPPPAWGWAYMAYPTAQMAWAVRAGFAKTISGIPNLGVPFRIVTTFDGGSTWTTRQMPIPAEASQIERPHEGTYLGGVGNCEFIAPAYSSTTIWKVALTCEDLSWLYTTANHGKTWIISSMPAGLYPDIHFVNPTTGWLFVLDPDDDRQGSLYRTSNGGQGWNLIKYTGWTDLHMSFLDEQVGWAVASTCPEQVCAWFERITALVKTTNGGETWQDVEAQVTR